MVAIVVEDGTGIVTANSYATVQEVDDLLSVNIHSNWSLLDNTAKENLIMWATRILDERVTWKGKKVFETSGLAWPRTGVRNKEGFFLPDDEVPAAVKLATAVLADHLVAGNPESTGNSTGNITKLKVDVVELQFDAKLFVSKYPNELKFILSGLGSISMGKGGYKRIIKH